MLMGNELSNSSELSKQVEDTIAPRGMVVQVNRVSGNVAECGPNEYTSYSGGIVTVHTGDNDDNGCPPDDAADLKDRLRRFPLLYPLLLSSVGLPDKSLSVETKSTQQFVVRLQHFVRQSAETVALNQSSINTQIRDIDTQVRVLSESIASRQKRLAQAANQLVRSRELSAAFSRIQMCLEATVRLAERLNQNLPPSDQLEPFMIAPFTQSSIND